MPEISPVLVLRIEASKTLIRHSKDTTKSQKITLFVQYFLSWSILTLCSPCSFGITTIKNPLLPLHRPTCLQENACQYEKDAYIHSHHVLGDRLSPPRGKLKIENGKKHRGLREDRDHRGCSSISCQLVGAYFMCARFSSE